MLGARKIVLIRSVVRMVAHFRMLKLQFLCLKRAERVGESFGESKRSRRTCRMR
jgi:hypothetical protein